MKTCWRRERERKKRETVGRHVRHAREKEKDKSSFPFPSFCLGRWQEMGKCLDEADKEIVKKTDEKLVRVRKTAYAVVYNMTGRRRRRF